MSLVYAYGFARPNRWAGLAGLDGAPVDVIRRGDIALLGSAHEGDADPDPWDGVVAHHRVLSEALERGPLVPLQPGYLMEPSDCEALLAAEHDRVDRLLERFAGRMEAKVQFAYPDEDSIVREIVAERPQLARQGPGYGDRVRAGEAIVERLGQKREQDAQPLIESLEACSEMMVRHEGSELSVLDASFLIEQSGIPQFEEALGHLQEQHRDRMALKYIAPLPFYSFVDVA